MATSEPLVPTGLPYGERAKTREAMQQAGVPLAPPSPAGPVPPGIEPSPQGSPSPAGGAPLAGLDLLASTAPGDYPFATGETAAPPPTGSTGSVLDALAVSAQSSFARAVLARLQSR